MVLFRDYGLYDEAQVKLHSKNGRKLAENLYIKADGTMVHYFSKSNVIQLFESVGFTTVEHSYCTSKVVNVIKKLPLFRVWIHAKFQKKE